MSDRAARIQGFFWTIASAIIFGLQPMISITIYEEGANAIFVCWGRLAVATIGMALLCKFVFHRSFAITKKEFGKLLICAQGFALTPLFLYSSYNYMASGLATTVHFTYPVLVLLGCMIFLHRPMSNVKKFCCVLCFAGIAFMSDLSGGMSVTGFALSFISAIAFAGYIIYLDGSGLQEMHPAKLAAWLSLIGAVELSRWCLPPAICAGICRRRALCFWYSSASPPGAWRAHFSRSEPSWQGRLRLPCSPPLSRSPALSWGFWYIMR